MTLPFKSILLGLALPLGTLSAKDPAPAKPVPASAAESSFAAFGQMIPAGTRNRQVRVPSFDGGKPTSLITADTLTRINETELFAEKMVIETYSPDPKQDLRVQLHTGTYHMEKKTLSSDERSKVSRSDFTIEGDSMVYDTVASQGRMVGRVVMVIHDSSTLSPAPAAKEAPKPAASAAPKTP
jgi:hypothetical protein